MEENPDNIVGTIHKDLLRARNIHKNIKIKELIQKPLFISKYLPFRPIKSIQKSTIQVVFVIDEYGDLQG